MAILRNAWLEWKALGRVAGLPCAAALLMMALVIQAQEPSFARRAAVGFFWPSMQAVLALVVALLPMVWVLSRRTDAAGWAVRWSGRPWRATVAGWLGIVGLGVTLIGWALAAAVTVRGILGNPLDAGALGALVFRSLCVLAPLAALAPGLARLGFRPSTVVWIWLLSLGICAGLLGRGLPIPLDRFLGERIEGSAAVGALLLNGVETTLAGLALSTVIVGSKPCASVSSETSTATSRL